MSPPLFALPAGSPFTGTTAPTAPAVSAPPSFAQQPQAPVQRPSLFQTIAPIAAAFLAGGKDPAAMGSGLAAFMRGRQMRQAQGEHDEDRVRRQQIEQAEFYSRMVEQANQIDDPIIFERWKQAIAPVAQVHGISTEALTFSDEKRQAKDTRLIKDALDAAVTLHGPEILNRDDVAVSLPDGRQVPMPIARGLRGGMVTAQGKAVTVPDTTKQPTPRQAPQSGSFEDYVSKKYGNAPTPEQILEARKAYNQVDDRPRVNVTVGGRNPREVATFNGIVNAYERSPLVKAADRTIVLDNAVKAIEKNPGDPASQLQLAYSYIQALDTYQSAVREGELQNLGVLGTRLQSFVVQLNRVANEGAFLPPEVAKNIAANAKQLVAAIKEGHASKQRQFASQAKVSGVGDMWAEFVAGSVPAARAETATPSTAQPMRVYYDANGKRVQR